jgi:nicotinamide-nucleotide amidase
VDAHLIAVGSELLRFGRPDTNGDWLAERLNRCGFEIRGRAQVEDDPGRIATAVRSVGDEPALVVLTGGLGPTEDDRTRHGLALWANAPLERDEEVVAWIRSRFRERGIRWREAQSRQADRPAGAEWLRNPLGAAPGLWLRRGELAVAALPGVPAEMRAMFRESLAPRLHGLGTPTLARRTLKIAGRTETSVDTRVRDLYDRPGAEVTILTASGEIELHLLVRGRDPDETAARLAALDAEFAERLGSDLYGRDDDTLAGVVGDLLARSGRTLATAESCTAGLLSAAVTAVPGASGWFRGGYVLYADDLKREWAGVTPETLARHGAVSAEVARAIAAAARSRAGASIGIGITGIAGPGGGTESKPVGRVHLALDDEHGTVEVKLDLGGGRELVRRRTVAVALDRLRRRLLKTAG